MKNKNFLDFGIYKNKKKIVYETLIGDLYDTYMFGRYFNDIYNLDKLLNKKTKFKKNIIHDLKDLKFNLINFLLILNSDKKRFYEFGFTLYEKIFFFKYFNKISKKKINLKKINFFGNDISNKFIFFTKNFYNSFNIKVSKNVNFNHCQNSIFFSKGISLLYEKKNILLLKKIIDKASSGSCDISFYPNRKIKLLKTGLKLYFPSILDMKNIIKNSNKHFFYRNKKRIGSKTYLEIIFGNQEIGKKINQNLDIISNDQKDANLKNRLFCNKKFYKLDADLLK